MMLAADALQQFVSSETLFGPLAQSTDFHQLMQKAVDKVNQWVTSSTH